MAIGRLLSPKLTPHFSSRGFVPLTRRWVSSSLEDGRKFEKRLDSKASANKDIGKKGMHWYSLGGLLTNLKQKITGNMLLFNKPSGEDSGSPKSPMVSSGDVTVTKVVSLQNVAENENCNLLSIKEGSSVSEVGSQDASQSVAGIEISRKRESTCVNKERLDNKSLDCSEFDQENLLRLIQAERVDLPEEPSSKDVPLGLLTEEAPESLALAGENQGKFQPEKGQSDQKKPPRNKLSSMFIDPDPDKEVKLPLRFKELSNSNSSMSTGESCSDLVQEIKNISKENDKHRFPDALEKPGFLASIRDLAAITERESTFSFKSPKKTVVPVEVSRDLGMKKLMDSLNRPTDNSTGADANLWNPSGGEGTCISKGDSVTRKSDSFCAMEEEESKGETLVMQTQSFCTQAALATTTAESLDALSVGEHSPNKVVLRFLKETFEKKDIVEVLSVFGAVSDVQEIPSFQGCIYKDALVTFKTNTAVKKALKKAVVVAKWQNVVIEATSQEDMVERIRIPDLIGDPDVPIASVKEPVRTVKIHPLEHGISSNQIKEALRFCRSDISKFTLSSSKTAAFVEFETEDGKERAVAAHSISIFNKQLFISRIDIPRTTVARITNVSQLAMEGVRKLCVPYGQVSQVFHRSKGIADVHFKVSEWPNMLTILNKLNGKEVDGMKWLVRPATMVIPPEILKVLWEDPQGKRYVKGVIHNLVRELEQPLEGASSYTLVTDLLQ